MRIDKLTGPESQTAIWLKLQEHMRTRLNELRSQNDGQLSETETARLRGRIAQLKELLDLGVPDQAEVEADS